MLLVTMNCKTAAVLNIALSIQVYARLHILLWWRGGTHFAYRDHPYSSWIVERFPRSPCPRFWGRARCTPAVSSGCILYRMWTIYSTPSTDRPLKHTTKLSQNRSTDTCWHHQTPALHKVNAETRLNVNDASITRFHLKREVCVRSSLTPTVWHVLTCEDTPSPTMFFTSFTQI